MSGSDDTADATIRLEQALERIALLARRSQDSRRLLDDPPDTAVLTTRLDALILRVRSALE